MPKRRWSQERWRAVTGSLILVASGCVLGGTARSEPVSREALRDLQLRPGVVLISIPLRGSIPELGVRCPEGASVTGSGFLFRPDGYVMTSAHVAQFANVKDADALRTRNEALGECLVGALRNKLAAERRSRGQPPLSSVEQQQIYSLVVNYLRERKVTIVDEPAQLRVCLGNRQCFDGDVRSYSAPFIDARSVGKDVAIIKIDGHDLPTVPLGDSDSVNVNDPVYVIGYPRDAKVSATSTFVATSTDGRISAVKRLDHPDIPVLETSAAINPGSSGGPAFDAQGRVIGIATFKSGAAYNYLVPINVALELVRQTGVAPRRGTFDQLWQQALAAYAHGRWGPARRLLQDVLHAMPLQPEAERLEREAAANERAEGPWQRFLDLGAGGVIVALLGTTASGALLAVVLIRARGRRRSPAPVADSRDLAMEKALGAVGAVPALALTIDQLGRKFGTLHISAGPLNGQRFVIPKEGLVLGREPGRCAIVLPDDSISKDHAWVVPVDDGVVVIDRGSSNGTYVNSIDSPRISKVLLRSGDRIYLGRTSQTVLTYLR
jgi:hypothetical protein